MGVPGGISKDAMKYLAGSFESFVETNQANGDTDELPRKNLASILNNFVSSDSTTDRKQDKLLNRLLQETAINLIVRAEPPVEDQKNQRTNYGNINLWFDTWEKDLVGLGFEYRDDKENMLFLMSSLEESSILTNPDFPWVGAKGDVEADCQYNYSTEAYQILEDLPQNPVKQLIL